MNLRSALIWSFVTVDNLDFQLPDAYHKTNRYSANLVFSPIERIDLGVEYLYGTRRNLDGHKGNADRDPGRRHLQVLIADQFVSCAIRIRTRVPLA